MSKLKLLAITLIACTTLSTAAPAFADGPTLNGAGSTWSQVALSQWISDFSSQGKVNYNGVGSTAGRQLYIQRKVDFAVSEVPFTVGEKSDLGGTSFQYLPIVAGGTSIMYHLCKAGKSCTGQTGDANTVNLNLSGETAAGIFTGAITNWSDPKIKADNPNTDLPDAKIKVTIRSDGSGTSAQFAKYLISKVPSMLGGFFSSGSDDGALSQWPPQGVGGVQFVGASGSDGVANFVAGEENSITYVEASYAQQRRFPVAGVKNASGNYAKPESGNVAIALKNATFNAGDRTQQLGAVYTSADPAAYPISSYSYMITPTKPADLTVDKAKVLGDFMVYFACKGQQVADRLGYSPLPENLVQEVFNAVKALPGSPVQPPPLTKEGCPNPNLLGTVQTVAPPAPPPAAAATTTTRPGTTAPQGSGATTTTVPSGNNPAGTAAPPSSGNSNSGSTPSPGSAGSATPSGANSGATPATSTGASPKASPTPAKTTGPTGTSGALGTKSSTKTPSSATTYGSSTDTSSPTDTTSTDGTGSGGGTIDSADASQIIQRLTDLESRVAALEAARGGTDNSDQPVDPKLKANLLSAAEKVDSGSSSGTTIALLLIVMMFLAPFLKPGFGALTGRVRRRPRS